MCVYPSCSRAGAEHSRAVRPGLYAVQSAFAFRDNPIITCTSISCMAGAWAHRRLLCAVLCEHAFCPWPSVYAELQTGGFQKATGAAGEPL